MEESYRNGNGNKIVTVLLAICMFLSGVVVSGVGAVIRGDYLGREYANAAEARINARIDDTLDEINRRLKRLEDQADRYDRR